MIWGQVAPTPAHHDEESMHDLVIEDLISRREFGRKKYDTLLTAFNGRDPFQDLYEEQLDALCYFRQAMIEFAAYKDEIDALNRRVLKISEERDEWKAESTRVTLLLCEVAECLNLEHDDVLLASPGELRAMVNDALQNHAQGPEMEAPADGDFFDLIDDAVTVYWGKAVNWSLIPPTMFDGESCWDLIVLPETGEVWESHGEVPAGKAGRSWAVRILGAKRTPPPPMPPPTVDTFDYKTAYHLLLEARSLEVDREVEQLRRLNRALNPLAADRPFLPYQALPSLRALVDQVVEMTAPMVPPACDENCGH